MDDPSSGLISGLTPDMARQLLRLRELRMEQARQQAQRMTDEAGRARHSVKEGFAALERHRHLWREAETQEARRMNDMAEGGGSAYTLRQGRDRLDSLADRAVALQNDLAGLEKSAEVHEEKAMQAWRQHREVDMRCDHARRLLQNALRAEQAEQDDREEQELEDLGLMRRVALGLDKR